jgi:hypothetical protein
MDTNAAAATEPPNANGSQPSTAIQGTFAMTPARLQAADLLAEGGLSVTEIAGRIGVSRWAIWDWGRHVEFCRVVRQRREFYEAQAVSYGVALRAKRLEAAQDRWRRMKELIEARAAAMTDVAGGATGLLVRRVRAVADGKDFRMIEWFETDHGLLREMRSLEEHVARQLNQWSGPDGSEATDAREEVAQMTTAELLERARAVLRAAGELPPEASAADADGGLGDGEPLAAE